MKTSIFLSNCPSSLIDNLPENMQVRGRLSFYKCKRLRSLPKDLKVSGELNLYNSSLKSLPEGLKVGGWLSLNYCLSLKSIPDDLKVGDDIFINPDNEEGTGVRKEDFPIHLQSKVKMI